MFLEFHNIKLLKEPSLYSIEYKEEKDKYYIYWLNHAEEKIGRCNQKYNTEADAKKKAEEIQRYFKSFTDFNIHDPDKVKFKREIEDGHKHPLHHYSFTLTVFLSAWTARFANPEFKHFLENLFRENTPAHIALHFQWLIPKKMQQFEDLYDLWLTENRNDPIDFHHLNELSDQLLSFAKET